jgi:3-dehydroquinate dehydratase type I
MTGRHPLRICVSITAKTTREALAKMEEGFARADMVELRIDGIRKINLKKMLAFNKGEILITNRSKEEGGAFPGSERERVSLLMEAAALGADYVDLELRTEPGLLAELVAGIKAHDGKTKLILSYHNHKETPSPEALKKILEKGITAGADIIKIVPYAQEMGDNLRALGLIPYAQRLGKGIIAFCMGEKGRMSRVMAPLLGSYLTYASLARGEESARGQMTVEELKQIFRILKVGNRRKC